MYGQSVHLARFYFCLFVEVSCIYYSSEGLGIVSNPINKKVVNMKNNKDDPYIPTPEEQALIDDDVKKIAEELEKDPHALDDIGPAVTIVVDNPSNFEGFTF